MNQENKETKQKDEGRNIERSYKYCGKRRLFIVSISTPVLLYRDFQSAGLYRDSCHVQ
jgi:hypothetical protein